MTKDRFISISLSLSSQVKSQTEGTDIHPPTEFHLEEQLPLCLPIAYPRFIPFMPLTSYNFLAGDEELRDMPVFLMVEDHGMDGRITPEM